MQASSYKALLLAGKFDQFVESMRNRLHAIFMYLFASLQEKGSFFDYGFFKFCMRQIILRLVEQCANLYDCLD